jgi:hypothetical protein
VVARVSSFRRSGEFMTSDDRLSLILRRLDEIGRKLLSTIKGALHIQAKAYPLAGPTSGRHYLLTDPR